MRFRVHNVDFELVDSLDDPAFLGPIPKRCEFGRRRLERLLEMRAVSHQHVPEGHSIGTCAIRIGATLEQAQSVCVGETIVETHCRSVKK
jgi:hypothetical protein